jgi:hypothetical protein
MNISLAAPIIEGELQAIIRAMAIGKVLGPKKIVTKFFVKVWHIIGACYYGMIVRSIKVGRFPKGVTQGLITLCINLRRRVIWEIGIPFHF